MPKNSLTQDLIYLRLMDELLAEPGLYAGLNVSDFAREWKVDPHTVRRWLEALKALGQDVVDIPDPDQEAKVGRKIHRYKKAEPLFTKNYRPPQPDRLKPLQRLKVVDKELSRGRLDVVAFSREHKVSEGTVRGDLLLLRDIGQEVHPVKDQPPGRIRLGRRFQEYRFYRYASGERPLFARNDPRPDH